MEKEKKICEDSEKKVRCLMSKTSIVFVIYLLLLAVISQTVVSLGYSSAVSKCLKEADSKYSSCKGECQFKEYFRQFCLTNCERERDQEKKYCYTLSNSKVSGTAMGSVADVAVRQRPLGTSGLGAVGKAGAFGLAMYFAERYTILVVRNLFGRGSSKPVKLSVVKSKPLKLSLGESKPLSFSFRSSNPSSKGLSWTLSKPTSPISFGKVNLGAKKFSFSKSGPLSLGLSLSSVEPISKSLSLSRSKSASTTGNPDWRSLCRAQREALKGELESLIKSGNSNSKRVHQLRQQLKNFKC